MLDFANNEANPFTGEVKLIVALTSIVNQKINPTSITLETIKVFLSGFYRRTLEVSAGAKDKRNLIIRPHKEAY